jgi:hypothetical protein
MIKFIFLVVFLSLVFEGCAYDPPGETVISKRRINVTYKLKDTKSDFINRLSFSHGFSDDSISNEKDSLFYITYFVEELNSHIMMSVELVEKRDSLIIKLDSLIQYSAHGNILHRIKKTKEIIDNFSIQNWSDLFNKYCIQRIKAKSKIKSVWLDNKNIYNKNINN